MPNWTSTSYAIEGPMETLKKIKKAVDASFGKSYSSGWEGYVLHDLGLGDLEFFNNRNKIYMRGFMEEGLAHFEDGVLRLSAMEAWDLTDFAEVLQKGFPDIKVYYCVMEEGNLLYTTNDKEAKYFTSRFYLELCVGKVETNCFFKSEEEMYDWINEALHTDIHDMESLEAFSKSLDDMEYLSVLPCMVVG